MVIVATRPTRRHVGWRILIGVTEAAVVALATGILMARTELSVDEVTLILLGRSAVEHRPIADIAADIVRPYREPGRDDVSSHAHPTR